MKLLSTLAILATLVLGNACLADDPQWTTDWPSYLAAQGARPLVRGVSPAPAPTEAEAMTTAEADAVETIVPRVRAALGRHGDGISDESLRSAVHESLQWQLLIVDRHIERIVKPYATVWAAQVLVDLSPQNLKTITTRATVERQSVELRNVTRLAAMVCCVVGVCVASFFVNNFTRGYFTGRVVLGSIAMLVLSTGVVWVMT